MEIIVLSLAIALGLFMVVGVLALIVDTVGDWLEHREYHKFMKQFRKESQVK